MSVKVSSWAWHEASKEISGNELVVLLALADVASDSGECRYWEVPEDATQIALARKCRIHRATLVRCIASLVAKGVLVKGRGRQHDPNSYRIQMSQVATSDDSQMSHPVEQMSHPVDSDVANEEVAPLTVRTDVTTRDSSAVAAVTTGAKFAQPLCDVLVLEMHRNEAKVPSPLPKKWLDDARLMIDRDGRDPRQAKSLIEWATHDSFWRSNILSMPTFRKQYDKLRLASERESARPVSKVEKGRAVDEELARREIEQQRAVAS